MPARPHYFIVRPGTNEQASNGATRTVPGPIVPLIAVDELPEWFEIVGVPRDLMIEQTLGMSNLGTLAREDGTSYEVRIEIAQDEQHFDPPPGGAVEVEVGSAAEAQSASSLRSIPADDPALTVPELPVGQKPASDPTSRCSERPGLLASIHASAAPLVACATDSAVQNAHGTADYDIISQASPLPPHHSHRYQPHHQPQQQTVQHYQSPTQSSDNQQSQSTSGPAHRVRTTHGSPVRSSSQSRDTTTSNANSTTTSTTSLCRHWSHYGSCKWGTRCYYRHAMPTMPHALRGVGLNDLPRRCTSAMELVLSSGDGAGAGAGEDAFGFGFGADLGGTGTGMEVGTTATGPYLGRHLDFLAGGSHSRCHLGSATGFDMGQTCGMFGLAGAAPASPSRARQMYQMQELLALGILRGGAGGLIKRGERGQVRDRVRELTPLDRGRAEQVKGFEEALMAAAAAANARAVPALARDEVVPLKAEAPVEEEVEEDMNLVEVEAKLVDI